MRRLVKDMRGQAMIEMALVLPILLALVFGIIEFGNIYSHQLEVNNLARHSVRTAIVESVKTDAQLETEFEARMPGAVVDLERDVATGDITATVVYECTLITGQILGLETKELTAVATMKAER